jgi:hypothetical protein
MKHPNFLKLHNRLVLVGRCMYGGSVVFEVCVSSQCFFWDLYFYVCVFVPLFMCVYVFLCPCCQCFYDDNVTCDCLYFCSHFFKMVHVFLYWFPFCKHHGICNILLCVSMCCWSLNVTNKWVTMVEIECGFAWIWMQVFIKLNEGVCIH